MRFPDRSDLDALANELGFDLTSDELDIFHSRAAMQMRSMERIMALHQESSQNGPGRVEGVERDWSYPADRDNPHRAFVTTCKIRSNAEGPLNGMRVGLKDSIAVAGVPMSLGSLELAGYTPEFDATVTQRLLHAGAEISGKMNMYEFASGDTVGGFGRVLNPVAAGRETGGSSSGSAAAVAAGELDATLGGDQGGSVRIPAAWCGIFGFKPTFGLVPHTGIFGADPTIDHVGPLARNTQDIAKIMDAIAGGDGLDVRQADVPDSIESFEESLGAGIKGKRICLIRESFQGGDAEALERPVRKMAETLQRKGALIGEVSIPLHNLAGDAWLAIWLEGTWYMNQTFLGSAFQKGWYPESAIRAFSHAAGHNLPYNYRQMAVLGAYLHKRFFGTVYARSQNLRSTFKSAYDAALKEADLLVLPTMRALPPEFRTGQTYRERVDLAVFGGGGIDLAEFVGNVAAFSYTGHPAITVPCGEVDGLPVGGQIVGRFFEDPLVLRAARAVEEAA